MKATKEALAAAKSTFFSRLGCFAGVLLKLIVFLSRLLTALAQTRHLRLRRSEWVLVWFLAAVAALTPFFQSRPHLGFRPVAVLAAMVAILTYLATLEEGSWSVPIQRVRDWLPIGYTFVAFREMEFFLPLTYNRPLEASWIRLDQLILGQWHLRSAIENFGSAIPFYLELCYLLDYAVAPVCIVFFYILRKQQLSDKFWTIYWSGTLLAYLLIPYFPAQPPRLAFPSVETPNASTWVRELNLAILRNCSIHSGVFPSAHVSSALASAFALLLLFPERKIVGLWSVVYTASVALAAVYGRYHYVADVLAALAVCVVPGATAILLANMRGEKCRGAPGY